MLWNLFQILVGLVLLGELIYCILKSKTGPDYSYYICRPFGIPFPMGIGAIIRLLCAIAGAIFLYRGLVGLF